MERLGKADQDESESESEEQSEDDDSEESEEPEPVKSKPARTILREKRKGAASVPVKSDK